MRISDWSSDVCSSDLLRPDRGHIRIGDRTLFGGGIDLPPEARRIGYVFQDGRLFPHRRVRANLLYGPDLAAPADRRSSLDRSEERRVGKELVRPGSLRWSPSCLNNKTNITYICFHYNCNFSSLLLQ